MATIKELKQSYSKKTRNTKQSPHFNISDGTLIITEYLVNGTECYQVYRKVGRSWEYERSES